MNSIESFKHLSTVGESGSRWLAGRRVAQVRKTESPYGRDPRDPEWQARTVAKVFLDAFDKRYGER